MDKARAREEEVILEEELAQLSGKVLKSQIQLEIEETAFADAEVTLCLAKERERKLERDLKKAQGDLQDIERKKIEKWRVKKHQEYNEEFKRRTDERVVPHLAWSELHKMAFECLEKDKFLFRKALVTALMKSLKQLRGHIAEVKHLVSSIPRTSLTEAGFSSLLTVERKEGDNLEEKMLEEMFKALEEKQEKEVTKKK
ncbi:hypothetical protein [Chlamydia vaughanii]|uniref:hypothetical protein n=1 Tax=Chlamydia vaughanii TaxID=3112552 RepID=UPI0032B216B9